ncbi:Cell surface metalloreductase [Penicillium ucsense]|uniref:ferric-chelate reductase (NADPH) n=1 Tax=Penicillium ucsense TaxID=2839758 RepID=A0A8J8VWM3_9EURO|nr:Cell surface metalloreductase [Penicillium ucsense]KAF7730767.1 Cell surface metalloreductase [Penicillium ucsense]
MAAVATASGSRTAAKPSSVTKYPIQSMEVLTIYAIAAGGIFLALFLIQARSVFIDWTESFSVLLFRHLTLPVLVHRHRIWGPWTRSSVLIHVIYITINITLVFFKTNSLIGAGRRAGELALINVIFPLSAFHLGYLADLVGITWRTGRKIHHVTGWMVVALLSFHVIAEVQSQSFSFLLSDMRNLFTMIGVTSLGVLALLSIPYFRQLSYEIFLRAHQILAGIFLYGTWQHRPAHNSTPKLYVYIALGILGLTTCLELVNLCYRNGLFSGRGAPRALVSFTLGKSQENGNTVTAAHIRVVSPRPVKVEPGQYINLWLPSVGLWSWAQTHPFTVTSWSRGKQNTMELLVQPRRGMTSNLLRYATVAPDSSVSLFALFTGPHGKSVDVGQYETALMIASGFGIAATIPYLKKMIYGYNTCTLQIRRLHLVWQIESIEMTTPAQSLLNALLEDDIIDKGYILSISVYVENGLAYDKTPFGKHERACFYQGVPDYPSIVSLEASGSQIERLPNIRDERGQTLVMASTSNHLRDHLREIVRSHLHQGVTLAELEYQPE